MQEKKEKSTLKKILYIVSVIARIAALIGIGFVGFFFIFIYSTYSWQLWMTTGIALTVLFVAALFVAFFPKKAIKKKLIGLGIIAGVTAIILITNVSIMAYKKSITIDVNININTNEYMPFDEKSKIARLDHDASLKLTDDLPIVDGASAAFPVYSAFVNAVYPSDIEIAEYFDDGVFQYNNTFYGYDELAYGNTDIFFGAYPSEKQLAVAEKLNKEFEFTHIANEAFVFFVNSDNSVDNLTTEQIKKIYGGEITNWKEVGGKDEEIVAFQRNTNSGSQSMFLRFMYGSHVMEPPKEQVNDLMSGIINVVADYKNTDAAIGFSFRYYLDTLIANPKVKMLSVDGVYPSVENIKNGSYPIVTPVYAVTVKGNSNPNVKALINWVLSSEGQELIEKTGYAGVESK